MIYRRNQLGQVEAIIADQPVVIEKRRPNYEAMIAWGSILGALASILMVLRGMRK